MIKDDVSILPGVSELEARMILDKLRGEVSTEESTTEELDFTPPHFPPMDEIEDDHALKDMSDIPDQQARYPAAENTETTSSNNRKERLLARFQASRIAAFGPSYTPSLGWNSAGHPDGTVISGASNTWSAVFGRKGEVFDEMQRQFRGVVKLYIWREGDVHLVWTEFWRRNSADDMDHLDYRKYVQRFLETWVERTTDSKVERMDESWKRWTAQFELAPHVRRAVERSTYEPPQRPRRSLSPRSQRSDQRSDRHLGDYPRPQGGRFADGQQDDRGRDNYPVPQSPPCDVYRDRR